MGQFRGRFEFRVLVTEPITHVMLSHYNFKSATPNQPRLKNRFDPIHVGRQRDENNVLRRYKVNGLILIHAFHTTHLLRFEN